MGTLAHVSSGVFEPLQIAGLTAFGAAYGIRAANLSRAGRPVPTWRVISYFSGIALIAIAFVSPLAHLGGELVFAHMIQHLLIADIAALLIVLGLTRAVLQPVMAIKAFDRLQFLTLPMVALPLWIANLYVWHIPALYDATVTNEFVHALQHACFITFGILMWMPIAGPLPVPSWFGGGAQVGYVVVARLASAGLGNILMWSGTALYVAYAPGEAYWNISATADQGTAGVIMMVEGGLITLGRPRLGASQMGVTGRREAAPARTCRRARRPAHARAGRARRDRGQGARLEERISGDPRPKTS